MKRFFKKIFVFIAGLFTNLNEWIYDHVQPSIETLQRIKAAVDNPLVDALVAVIPGDLDDKIRDWVSKNLTKAINVLHISEEILSQPTLELQLAALIAYIRSLSPSMRKGVYLRLASELAIASGGKENVKGHSVDLLVQAQYSKLAEGVEAADLPELPQEQPKQAIYNPAKMQWEHR